jgi:hypothetical protein
MNDILSMILYVLDDEADAFCCFSTYMDAIQDDFLSEGMMAKVCSHAVLWQTYASLS